MCSSDLASAARELLNKSGNERSGVLSTAMSFLGLYRDPVVAEVTRLREMSPLYEMVKEGVDLSKMQWVAH